MQKLKPNRIGHGIRAAYQDDALKVLADSGTVLEICPTSNLHTRAVRHLEEFRYILGTFAENGVRFTKLRHEGVSEAELEKARNLAFEASFIGT